MGSYGLPALHVNPPQQQPNLLESAGQLMQLKNMMANAPLQHQALQQSVQAGQLDIQQKQQAMKDQQAMSASMAEWSKPKAPSVTTSAGAMTDPQTGEAISSGSPLTVKGPMGAGAPSASSSAPDYDSLIKIAQKNGASFSAIQGLQKMVLDMKEKAATIAKDDAQTGASNASALKTKNEMLINSMSSLMNLPDDQLAPGLMSAAQELSQNGLLDPHHVQMAQQMAQMGDPAAIRKQLNIQIAGMGGFNKIIEDEQKKVTLANEKGKTDPTSPLYSPSATSVAMGTAPGAAQIQAGEVKQAARKSAAEAAAKQPFEMALARQRQALSQGDPNAAAQLLLDGDATLSELKARGSTPDFIARTLMAARQKSGGKYNAQEAEANFKVAQSPANVAFFGSSKSLTDKGGTLDQLAEVGKDIPGSAVTGLNSIADWEKAATSNGPLAHYAATALGVADDYAKVMGGGQGSDTSRLQALNLIKANQGPEARTGALQGIRGAVQSQTGSRIGKNPILRRMYGEDGSSPASAGGGNSSDPFAQFGGKAH